MAVRWWMVRIRWHEVQDIWNNVFAFSRINESGDEILVISNFFRKLNQKYKLGVSKWGVIGSF